MKHIAVCKTRRRRLTATLTVLISLNSLASTQARAGSPDQGLDVAGANLRPRVIVLARNPDELVVDGEGDARITASRLCRQLSRALAQTGRFEVVAPGRYGDGHEASRLAASTAAIHIGRIANAQYVVSFGIRTAGRTAGPGRLEGVFHEEASGGRRAALRLDGPTTIAVWLSDATNGTLVASTFITGNMLTDRWDDGEDDVMRHVPRDPESGASLFGRATSWVASRVRDRSWRGYVAEVDGDEIYLASGTDAGIEPGMEFELCSHRGFIAGSVREVPEWAPRTVCRVFDVGEEVALARVVRGTTSVDRGDVVTPTAGPGRRR